ncbi:MAG: hypothetical protein B6D35_09220 [Candidatus Brocadia sp. UTAMX2]|jgi:uncharacterized membrane protein|nr:MAG: hypothetical protein B6D35_09220 [Candidatus Brocadia sp. UTAMX2]
MEYVIIWCLFGVVTAIIARNKGESIITSFLAGLFFGPFGILIVLFVSGKKCPYCMSKIHREAIVCPKCQKDILKNRGNKKLY